MNDFSDFKIWLTENTDYSSKTISNIVSRFKRANSISPWFNDIFYFFRLEQSNQYQLLSMTVRSQLKKAVKLYFEYVKSQNVKIVNDNKHSMKVLSLFANIGVAEAYLKDIGYDVVIANELLERRAILYSKIYPETHMICGDITRNEVFSQIVSESLARRVDIILATPPCQGMSTVGQLLDNDARNQLICQVIEVVKRVNPKYVMIENVPSFFNTEIIVNNHKILIPEYLTNEVGGQYYIHKAIIDTKDFSVPQSRERAIVLMTRKDQNEDWVVPKEDKKIITMRDAIGNLPSLDPFITDVNEKELLTILPKYYERENQAKAISKWHTPPHHIKRQVIVMQHTPSGQTAFDNKVYYPIKADGTPVKGFRNTYKRQNWDSPAYTVTMDNRKISSQDNVHPGLKEYIDKYGNAIYSDARVLTLYELMKIMSIPDSWPIPIDTSEAFLRRIIGEGIPPLFVKKVFENLKWEK